MPEDSPVRRSAAGVYQGNTASGNEMPLVSLAPTSDFTRVVEASRAWTAPVASHSQLASMLRTAIEQITEQRRQALPEIRIAR
jgi:acetolactate synthase-1/2/3 large subunit